MQISFSSVEYANKKKITRRDRFLESIEKTTPWEKLLSQLEPYYPTSGKRGWQPIGLQRMLRMYVVQQCFGFSDESTADAIYDSQSIRAFIGIDLAVESAPDVTTLLQFRRLLEKHALSKKILDTINAELTEQGLLPKEGTIVDAAIASWQNPWNTPRPAFAPTLNIHFM